ncbi:MAG: hypothetical protein ACRCZF_07730, partial [Gemmataceae bacterium]
LLARGGTARVAAVSVAAAVEVPVYNLSVGGLHSYAVGEVGVLAHNTNPGECGIAGAGAANTPGGDEAGKTAQQPAAREAGKFPADPAPGSVPPKGERIPLPIIRNPVDSSPPLRTVWDSLKDFADRMRGNKDRAVAELRIEGGKAFQDLSGEAFENRGLPGFIEDWIRTKHASIPPIDLETWFGKCAELGCIAQALKGRNIDTVEKAREFFKGAMMQAAVTSKKPGLPGSNKTIDANLRHGKFKEPCGQTCAELMQWLGIRVAR